MILVQANSAHASLCALAPVIGDSLIVWWGRGARTTLVFALTFCYTGLGAKMSESSIGDGKLDEPLYQQKRNSYQQNQMTMHG